MLAFFAAPKSKNTPFSRTQNGWFCFGGSRADLGPQTLRRLACSGRSQRAPA